MVSVQTHHQPAAVQQAEQLWLSEMVYADLIEKFRSEDLADDVIAEKVAADKSLNLVRDHPDAPNNPKLTQYLCLHEDGGSEEHDTVLSSLFQAVSKSDGGKGKGKKDKKKKRKHSSSSSSPSESKSASSSSSDSSKDKKKTKKNKKDKKSAKATKGKKSKKEKKNKDDKAEETEKQKAAREKKELKEQEKKRRKKKTKSVKTRLRWWIGRRRHVDHCGRTGSAFYKTNCYNFFW